MYKSLSLFLFIGLSLSSQLAHSEWYVSHAEPSLVVRDAADVSGNKLGNIPPDGKVNVLEHTDKHESIGGRTGEWVKIDWQGKTGFVFNSQLTKAGDDKKTESAESTKDDAKEDAKGAEKDTTDNSALEDTLLDALRYDFTKEQRAGSSDKTIKKYVKAGLIPSKPTLRVDYTDYYVLKKPASFLDHDLIVLEEEYMSENIGCCVSEGMGLTVKLNGSIDRLKKFAEKSGCALEENVNLPSEFKNLGIDAPVATGDYATLSCRERDVER